MLIRLTSDIFAETSLAATNTLKTEQVNVTLISDYKSYAEKRSHQDGKPFELTVAVYFKIKKGWHLYWKNPGDSGVPINIKWSLRGKNKNLDKYFIAGPLQWPTPHRMDALPSIATFGYEDELLLASVLTLTEAGEKNFSKLPDELIIRAEIDWLVCKESCIPGEGVLEMSLSKVTSDVERKASRYQALMREVKDKLPRPHSDVNLKDLSWQARLTRMPKKDVIGK